MSSAKVLFLTDDRENYPRGNYYLAYQKAFMRRAKVTLAHPLEPMPDPSGFDLVVLGHASIEHFARMRGARFVPKRLRPYTFYRHAGLRALRKTRTPTLLFTKNDYKGMDVKNAFISCVRPKLVLTHTKSALAQLRPGEGGRLDWLPFGVDTEMFSPPRDETPITARPYALGFRASINRHWLNDDGRDRFFKALERLETKHHVSLTFTSAGESFLIGQPYVDWIRSCAILGNTVSAAGTVGPKFLEAMACGTVPLAPPEAYEGLLIPDVHYIAVPPGDDGSFPALEAAIDRFNQDRAFRQTLLEAGRELVRAQSVDEQVTRVCRELGV